MLGLALLASALACDGGEPTGVLVIVRAEPAVAALADAVEIEVRGGRRTASDVVGFERVELSDTERFPLLLGLNPRRGDTDRIWGVTVTVFDASDRPRIVRRAIGGYVRGESRRVTIVLEIACLDLLCSEDVDQTCLGGACRPTPTEEGEPWDGSPPEDMDAGRGMDGGERNDAGRDAEAMDVGCSCDDDDPCTVDECGPDGTCRFVPRSCDDGDDCTDDACDASDGECRSTPKADDAACAGGRCCEGACVGEDDPSHCGGCGLACGAGETCAAGECGCAEGFGDCDGDPSNGCEEGLLESVAHCGACDRPCSGEAPECILGACVSCGAASDCRASLSCEEPPRCDAGRCVHDLRPGACRIDGACVSEGAPHPSDPCLRCETATRTDGWTVDAGASCDDGVFCTVDTICDPSGVCGGGRETTCDDGLACTADSCDPLADACEFTVTTGCAIDGACLAAGAAHPTNGCLSCQPTVDPTSWQPDVGEPCDDGAFCTTGEACDAAGECTGGGDTCEDGLTCTMDSCDELADLCDNFLVPRMCTIDGTCYMDGALNPTNECQSCRRITSPTTWTDRDGSPCASGTGTCSGSTCVPNDAGGGGADAAMSRDAGAAGAVPPRGFP